MKPILWSVSLLAIITLAACGNETAERAEVAETATPEATVTPPVADAAQAVTATLQTAEGAAAGSATITSGGADGLRINIRAEGLPAGEHGIHIHTVGKCEPPKFTSAGDHWNPAGHQHGLENAKGPHAGDMPNLNVGSDGTGTLSFALTGGSIAELMDADGSAMVIHAKRDDQVTDPSGNSGDRIACGVFSQS